MTDYMSMARVLGHGLELGAVIGAVLGFSAALVWRPVFALMRWRLTRLERKGDEQASQ